MKSTPKVLHKIIINETRQPTQIPQPPEEIENAFSQYGQAGLDHKYDIMGLKNDSDILGINPVFKQLFATANIEHVNKVIAFLEKSAPELLDRYKQRQSMKASSASKIDLDELFVNLPPEIPGWDDI